MLEKRISTQEGRQRFPISRSVGLAEPGMLHHAPYEGAFCAFIIAACIRLVLIELVEGRGRRAHLI